MEPIKPFSPEEQAEFEALVEAELEGVDDAEKTFITRTIYGLIPKILDEEVTADEAALSIMKDALDAGFCTQEEYDTAVKEMQARKDAFFHFEDGSTEEDLDPETKRMADEVERMMRGFGADGVTFE
jgi:hypothetical protein